MIDSVGGFYERLDGTVVKTYGFKESGKVISYYEYKGKSTDIPIESTSGWKSRRDLVEFPNCDHVDKRLPKVFDLYFDIKTYGHLIDTLEGKGICDDLEGLKELMVAEGITKSGAIN